MRIIFLFFFIFGFMSAPVSGQKDYKANLLEYGRFSHAAISPSEDLIWGVGEGNIYKTNSFSGLWYSYHMKEAPNDNVFGDFDHIYFLTDRIIIAIASEGHTYFQYKSANKGLTWKKTKLGNIDRIDDIRIGNDKKIWMTTSTPQLFCSSDYGDSWKLIVPPEFLEGKRMDIDASFDDKYLFLTTVDDIVYKTTSQFLKWETITSPIKKGNDNNTRISNFNQVGSYYLVTQDKKVYYKKVNDRNWTIIPHARDFIINGQSNVYLLNEDLSISLINDSMKIEWTSSEKLDSFSDLYVQNGNLYAFTWQYIYKINKNKFLKNRLLTNEREIEAGHSEINWKGQQVSFDSRDVLIYDNIGCQWYRYMELPFDFRDVAVFENQIILMDADIENYYKLDFENKSFSKFILPSYLFDIDKIKVKSFRVEKGSEGCFHYRQELESYENRDNHYVKKQLAKDSNSTNRISLELQDTKEFKLIDSLLKIINNTKFKYLHFNEIGIKQSDINEYKAFIKKEHEEFKKQEDDSDVDFIPREIKYEDPNDYLLFPVKMNDTVFHFCESTLNSIKEIPDTIITRILSENSRWLSTTTNWVKISISLEDSTIISVYNEDYYPNYLRNAWIVDYNGLKFKINSLEIGKILNELGENKLMPKALSDKKYAIHQIVTYLYLEQLDSTNPTDKISSCDSKCRWISLLIVLCIGLLLIFWKVKKIR